VFSARSDVATDAPVPLPPFFGSRVVDDVALDTVFSYINEAALIRGQWQVRRGKRSAEEYERQMREEIYPRLAELKLEAMRRNILRPRVLYGYFPCNADGNDLVLYRPSALEGDALYAEWPSAHSGTALTEWQRFTFPRQGGDRYLCIADYFRPVESGETDVCAFHIVTVGAEASAYTARLFEEDRYQEYLYMHGLSVESAEALAEYWHRVVRRELGIDGKDADDVRRLFSQGYQGSRYSFGYPACPNLEDHRQLFDMLRPERIGVELTEEFQLVPEQSTSAIIVHHPQARYFNVK
jgi:5-methyltetrahydrofolate--homocysteine methyltransferase